MAGGRRLDDVLDGIGAGEVAGVRLLAERAAVAVGIRREVDAADGRRRRAPHRQARDAHAELRATVQPLPQRDDLTVAARDLGEEQRALRCLRARGAEEGLLQGAGCDGGEPFREVDEVLREVDVADVLQRLGLLRRRADDVRIRVAAVHDGDAGIAVKVFLPIAVPEVLHGPLDELLRVPVEVREAGHDIFLFLLENGVRAEVVFLLHADLLSGRWCQMELRDSRKRYVPIPSARGAASWSAWKSASSRAGFPSARRSSAAR